MTGSDGLFIGGSWRPGSERIVVEDPATEEPIAEVGAGTPDDALAACEAAATAQPAWARTSPRERAEVLRRVWALLVGATDELAELIVAEHGKPLADAQGEVVYAAEFFRWNAEEAVRLRGTLADAPAGGSRILVRHPPVGVVAVVTPWNFPAGMLTRKLAPALAAGNAVVVSTSPPTGSCSKRPQYLLPR